MALKALLGLLALVAVASASPAAIIQELQARDPAPDNIVYVTDAENFWSALALLLTVMSH